MVFQYLLTHSKALKPIIKEIKGKCQNWLFFYPSLTPTGGLGGRGGGEFDLFSRLSTYGFLLPPSTFYGSESLNAILKKIVGGSPEF